MLGSDANPQRPRVPGRGLKSDGIERALAFQGKRRGLGFVLPLAFSGPRQRPVRSAIKRRKRCALRDRKRDGRSNTREAYDG